MTMPQKRKKRDVRRIERRMIRESDEWAPISDTLRITELERAMGRLRDEMAVLQSGMTRVLTSTSRKRRKRL